MSLLLNGLKKYYTLPYDVLNATGGLFDDSFTLMFWLNFTSAIATTEQTLVSKYDGSAFSTILAYRLKASNAAQLKLETRRLTTDSVALTQDVISAGTWQWVAFVDGAGSNPQIYIGSLTSPPAEPSYVGQTAGAGNLVMSDDAAWVSRSYADTWSMIGKLGFVGISNVRMTAAEIRQHWPRPKLIPSAGWLHYTWPGLYGLSAIDWSGHATHGSMSGSHVQAGNPPVPFPLIRAA